ncbi:hypothetical protein Hanom_Chr14g01275771 [Helianthus anomalus]
MVNKTSLICFYVLFERLISLIPYRLWDLNPIPPPSQPWCFKGFAFANGPPPPLVFYVLFVLLLNLKP